MGNSKRNIKKLNDNFREDILDYAFAHNLKCANTCYFICDGLPSGRTPNRVTVNYDSKKNEIEFRIIGSKLNRRMRRGIGVRKIKVKINNENARFLKTLLINLLKTQCHMITK